MYNVPGGIKEFRIGVGLLLRLAGLCGGSKISVRGGLGNLGRIRESAATPLTMTELMMDVKG